MISVSQFFLFLFSILRINSSYTVFSYRSLDLRLSYSERGINLYMHPKVIVEKLVPSQREFKLTPSHTNFLAKVRKQKGRKQKMKEVKSKTKYSKQKLFLLG